MCLNKASILNFIFLGSLEVSHYYYPGGGWVGGWVWVEIIRIKAVLSSTGLDWTGTELGKGVGNSLKNHAKSNITIIYKLCTS